ncbi:MAG: lysylphosphatidylglycerol synthase domain-containing protein [Rhodospirillaceae bacterium]
MRLFKLLTLIGGVAIFAWILSRADLGAVTQVMTRLGTYGAAVILATFGVAMVSDVISWALMFRSVALSAAWSVRLWLVLMVGEAFNMLTPFGAFGGEPFKALLLKRHYDISYTEGTASLVLIQTVNSLAQVPFAVIGAVLMVRADILPDALETGILAATAVISAFMVFVYVALHSRLLAKLPARMQDDESAAKLTRAITFFTDLEERLFHFVRNTPGRSAAALLFAFVSWVLGAVEIYFVFIFLDAPITFADAWIVETVIVLVRSATFFVPAHIGVQDGALTMVGRALTGSNEIGLAMALIRRGRELFWAGVGLLIYAGFNLRDRKGE